MGAPTGGEVAQGQALLTGSIGLGVGFALSSREGGLSEGPYATANLGLHVGDDPAVVAENRRRLAQRLGLADRVVYMDQVHGRAVTVVDTVPAELPSCDALVTAAPELGLAVLVADCVPVLLADPVARVVAAAHAGRKGVQLDVVGAAVEAMQQLGAQPRRIAAVLGPAICGRCYEVPQQMQDDVVAVVPAAAAVAAAGTPGLDLRAGLARRLGELGITAVQLGPCTAESPAHYSYRRDGVTGRFAGVVWLR